MARALYDQFAIGGRGQRVTFSTRGRSRLSNEYMAAVSGRFSNREAWREIAKNIGGDVLYLPDDGKGWSWKNSATWHKIARKDDATYNRTGGMWSGLHVRNYGASAAVIEFRGQTIGQTGAEKKARGRVREGEKRRSSWSQKVPNRLKAWTVFEEHGVLVVAPDREVQQALENAVGAAAENWSRLAIGGGALQVNETARGGMGVLTREFLAAMQGR